jgi:hypothetical protein
LTIIAAILEEILMLRIVSGNRASTVTKIQARQVHQPENLVEKLKLTIKGLKVDAQLQQKLANLHEEYYPGIKEWIRAEEKQAGTTGVSVDNPHARAAAEALTISNSIHEVSGFLLKYDIRYPEADLLGSIQAFHRIDLEKSSGETFRNLPEEKKIQVMLCVEPGVLEKIGISKFPISEQVLNKLRQDIPTEVLLNEAEFLATIDYLSSTTKLFAAINNAGRSKAYYQIPLFADAVQAVSNPLKSGLKKLSLHPLFKRTDIVVYKGVAMSDEAGAYRRAALDDKLTKGGVIYFPHSMSASEELTQSYSYSKSPDEYNVLLHIKIKQGAAVDCLHDIHTAGEQEIVAPEGMRCKVLNKNSEDVYSLKFGRNTTIDVYELQQV